MATIRYSCPNDGEVLVISQNASTDPVTESYICPFCKYKTTKSNALSLVSVSDTYVPPSKQPQKKK